MTDTIHVLLVAADRHARALCGHLHEAKEAFLDLENKAPGLVDAAVGQHADGQAAVACVRQIYREKPPAKHRKVFLDAVRNFVAFHYNPEMLRRALAKHLAAGHLDGTLILSPHAGLGRYTMTDTLSTLLLSDELGGQIEGFQKAFLQKVEEVINLAGALSRVVDHVVGHVLLDAGKLQVNTENDIVRVDPPIERAHQAVLAMRRRAGATNDRRHLRS